MLSTWESMYNTRVPVYIHRFHIYMRIVHTNIWNLVHCFCALARENKWTEKSPFQSAREKGQGKVKIYNKEDQPSAKAICVKLKANCTSRWQRLKQVPMNLQYCSWSRANTLQTILIQVHAPPPKLTLLASFAHSSSSISSSPTSWQKEIGLWDKHWTTMQCRVPDLEETKILIPWEHPVLDSNSIFEGILLKNETSLSMATFPTAIGKFMSSQSGKLYQRVQVFSPVSGT